MLNILYFFMLPKVRHKVIRKGQQHGQHTQGVSITARVNTAQGVRCRAVAEVLPDFAAPCEPTLEDAYLYLIAQGEPL